MVLLNHLFFGKVVCAAITLNRVLAVLGEHTSESLFSQNWGHGVTAKGHHPYRKNMDGVW